MLGINTFGLNSLLLEDWEGTFKKLKEIGYSAVEPLVLFPEAMGMKTGEMEDKLRSSKMNGRFWTDAVAKERIFRLREMGFQVYGVHLALAGMVPGGMASAIPYMKKFGREQNIRYFVHSPKKDTIAAVQEDVKAFRKGIAELAEDGIELLFHCHYNEFQKDGEITVFDYLLQQAPKLKVELDVGWVCFAGEDVSELMKRYGERIALIHFKDIIKGADMENTDHAFTAIGEGSIPLEQIMEEAARLPLEYVKYIVDQDGSNGDMMRDLSAGYQNIMDAAGL